MLITVRGELKTHPMLQTADLLHQGGTLTSLPASLPRACACSGARVCCSCGSAVYTSMAECSKHTVEEAGFDISGSENVSNPVFQVARSSGRTVAHRRRRAPRRVTARSLLARRGTKVGIHRKWKNAGPLGISARGLTHDRSDRQRLKFLGGVRERLFRRFVSFPTVCLGRERHTVHGDSVETPPKYFNSLFPAERDPLLHLLDYSPAEVSRHFHPSEFDRCCYSDFSGSLFWSVDFGAEALPYLEIR